RRVLCRSHVSRVRNIRRVPRSTAVDGERAWCAAADNANRPRDVGTRRTPFCFDPVRGRQSVCQRRRGHAVTPRRLSDAALPVLLAAGPASLATSAARCLSADDGVRSRLRWRALHRRHTRWLALRRGGVLRWYGFAAPA